VKVLIADDSRAMRRIIAAMLREAGFRKLTLLEAGDGAEALGKAVDEAPDVVISDWNMPNMTGIQFLQNLRQQGIAVPFGFVTTEVSPEMRELATESGAAFLIGKPFTPTDFVRALSDYLD
jgi:two-component system, chemotaxis family, chemotaxis protein CheY